MTTHQDKAREIALTKGRVAIVDDDDFAELSKFKWQAKKGTKTFYARRSAQGKTLLMHRVLMNPKQGEVVDHINGNGLDNRRKNLRVTTQMGNCANSRKPKNAAGYRGVFRRTGTYGVPYYAIIANCGKKRYLGQFHTAEEAAKAYDSAAVEAYGKFAQLNFPAIRSLASKDNGKDG